MGPNKNSDWSQVDIVFPKIEGVALEWFPLCSMPSNTMQKPSYSVALAACLSGDHETLSAPKRIPFSITTSFPLIGLGWFLIARTNHQIRIQGVPEATGKAQEEIASF